MKHLETLVRDYSECPACLLPFQVLSDDNDNNGDRRKRQPLHPILRHYHWAAKKPISQHRLLQRLPTCSRTCEHRICQLCVLESQILIYDQQHPEGLRRRQDHYHLPCPKCASPRSFPGKRPPMVDKELELALKCVTESFASSSSLNNKNQRRRHNAAKKAHEILVQNCHDAPWKLPLGLYPHVLEKVANWPHGQLSKDTLFGLLRGGLVQVHDFKQQNLRE